MGGTQWQYETMNCVPDCVLGQCTAGNTLGICYGCDHILEIETLNRLLWFQFDTWLRFRVAIRIATLIATLVETSVPERLRVANRVAIRVDPEGSKIHNPGGFSMVAIRVAIRVANRVSIAISQP